MGPTVLSDALKGLTPPDDANLLVGYETSDDAAVYRLSDEIAMINTVDFITPPVDDPYWFGQIAAANSISDVYSMGGRPLTALNVVMFPSKLLDIGILADILKGSHDKVVEAGASLVGGHTVDDEEPKFGLCVNGIVHPESLIRNVGAKPGDKLILTKPIGSGVLFNAVRSGKFTFRQLERETLPLIAALNGPAIEAAEEFEINACTDITGFGIAGHALEMAGGSKVSMILTFAAIPIFSGALDMYRKGETTGSNKANRALSAKHLCLRTELSGSAEELLFDPQTSGGLLLSIPEAQAERALKAIIARGAHTAAIIGEVTDPGDSAITVV
ncbi:MAG: selenide, water dikinase SelD [Proteobacteria bacterium]|nr:selenide, water dikinase SelD [Pseudomonadota bacterium]MBU1738441.1 selenide, water dikinase SelD [Pseudomonadota bacterium]